MNEKGNGINRAAKQLTGRALGGTAPAFVVILTAGVLPLYCLWDRGVELVFHHFSADAFYYLAVAKASHTGFYTYDGTVATNNFHPLWQYALTFLFGLIDPANQSLQLKTVFVVCVTLVTAGYVLTALAIRRLTGSVLLAVLLIPGLHDLVLGRVAYYPSAPWRFINGMESCCSILFAGAFLLFLSRRFGECGDDFGAESRCPIPELRRSLFLIGLLIGLLALCRLDDGLLLVAFSGVIVAGAADWRVGAQRVFALFLGASLFILPYLVFNKWSAGTWLPLSGIMKSGFALFGNLQFVFLTLLPGYLFGSSVEGRAAFPIVHWTISIWRTCQMMFPILVAVFFLAVRKGRRDWESFVSRPTWWIDCLLVYVILKSTYHLTATDVILQGEWYYSVSLLTVNFVAFILVAKPFASLLGVNRAAPIICASLVVFLLAAVGANYAHYTGHTDKWSRYYSFWSSRAHIESELGRRVSDVRIIEFDDGIIGYSLVFPTINGMNAINLAAHKARTKGQFFDYCRSRNFNTIAYLFYNPIPRGIDRPEQIESILEDHWSLSGQGADQYHFELIYRHNPSGAVFIRFEPKQTARVSEACSHSKDQVTSSPP